MQMPLLPVVLEGSPERPSVGPPHLAHAVQVVELEVAGVLAAVVKLFHPAPIHVTYGFKFQLFSATLWYGWI